jgi:hypothetical protein
MYAGDGAAAYALEARSVVTAIPTLTPKNLIRRLLFCGLLISAFHDLVCLVLPTHQIHPVTLCIGEEAVPT